MTNIKRVASAAGVSVATVSRTLQQPNRVSPKTRNKVMQAVDEIGYKPNLMAVKFRSGKTYNLVVLVPTVANVFFSRVISGMQKAAEEKGYSLLLANTLGNREVEDHYAKMVQTSQADGLIQLRAYNPFASSDRASTPSKILPMVNICEVLNDAPYPVVTLDNRAAAQAMTEHLLSLGHQRIALIKGPDASPLTQERLAGYKDALQQAGLPFDEALLYPGNFTLQSGFDAAMAIIKDPNLPTAVFCENDETAIGALQAFKQAKLSVPADISVAGFDDISFAAFSDPPLTTIAQPAEEFGRTAILLLLDILNGDMAKSPKVILPFELIKRGSTGPVRSPIKLMQRKEL